MSKHLGNLKRLQSKLTARYGVEDDLVLQIMNELELLKAIESNRVNRFPPTATLRNDAERGMQPHLSK